MFSAISCIYNTRRVLSRAARRVRSHPRGLNPGVMPAMDSPDPGGLGEAELTEPLAALAPRAVGAQNGHVASSVIVGLRARPAGLRVHDGQIPYWAMTAMTCGEYRPVLVAACRASK